jgi:hypothetical protein
VNSKNGVEPLIYLCVCVAKTLFFTAVIFLGYVLAILNVKQFFVMRMKNDAFIHFLNVLFTQIHIFVIENSLRAAFSKFVDVFF